MRVLTVFFILNLLLSVPLMVFGLESTGAPSCVSSFNGSWFEGSSDSTITEKWEWKNLGSMYPYIGRSDEEVDPASIFGKVTTSQGTKGTGVVGVSVEGDVSGPDFEMTMGPQFEINTITPLDYIFGGGDAWSATTRKTVKSKQSTSIVGPYTLNGSGTVIAVSGGGGIVILDTGFQTSGSVTFSFSPTAAPKVLDVTVEKDMPKAYECGHQDCEAALPRRDYHLITCGADIINHHGGIGSCREKYYICQGSCLLAGSHVSNSGGGGSTPPTGSTPPSNLDIQYACGDHSGPSSGSSGHTAASCGTSGHYICDGTDHSLQASCSSTDSNGNTCTVTSFYACDSHTHSYPPTTVECGHSNCSEMVSSRTSHRATCGSGSHTYWPGCPNNTSGWDQDSAHALKTCGRSACRQTWRSCQSSTPTCLANSRKKCSAR